MVRPNYQPMSNGKGAIYSYGGGSVTQQQLQQRRRSWTYLAVALGLSALCIGWIFLLYWLFSSPTKFDVAEAEALTKFIVRSLGDALPDPPHVADGGGGDGNGNNLAGAAKGTRGGQNNADSTAGGGGGGGGGPIYIFGFSETDDNVASVASGVARAYSDLITAGHPSSGVKILLFDVLNDGSPQDTLERRLPNYSGSKKMLRLIRSGTTRSSTGRAQHFMNLAHAPTYPDDFEIHKWKHSTIHTLREAKAAVTACKAAGASALVVVATPFHLPRALLTTLSVAAQSDKHLKIYSHTGLPLRWDETVAHSQGMLVGDRESLLDSEMERMFVYHRKGDLMRPSEALEALRKRDRRTASLYEALSN